MLNIDPYSVLRENHKLKNNVTGLNSVVQEQADIIIKLKLRLSDLESNLKRKKEEQRCLRGERMRLCKQLFRCQVDLLTQPKQLEEPEEGISEILSRKSKRLYQLLQKTRRGNEDDQVEEVVQDGVITLKRRVANVALAAERLLREIDTIVTTHRHQETNEMSAPNGIRSLAELKKVSKEKLNSLLNSGQPCDVFVSPLLAGMLDADVVPDKVVRSDEPNPERKAHPDYRKAVGLIFTAKPRAKPRVVLPKERDAERETIDELIWEAEELARKKKNYRIEYTSLLTVRETFKDINTQTDEKAVEHRAVGDDIEEPTAPAEDEEEAKRDQGIANLEAMGQDLFAGLDVQQVLDGHEEEDADTCFGKSDTKVFNTTTSTASDEQIDQFTKICMSLRTDRQSMDARLQELHTKIHQRRKAAVESLKDLETCLLKLEDFALDRTNEATAGGELSAKDIENEKNKLRHLTQNAHTALHSMRQSMHRYSGQLELYGSMQQESKVSAAVDIMLVYLKMLKDEHDQKDRELQKIKRDMQESISNTIIRRRMNKVRPIEISVDGNVMNLDTQLKLHSASESSFSQAEHERYLDGPNLELRDVMLECDITSNRDLLDRAFDFACTKVPKLEAYLTVDESAIDHILDEEERLTQLSKLGRVRKVRVAQGILLIFISIFVLLAVLLI